MKCVRNSVPFRDFETFVALPQPTSLEQHVCNVLERVNSKLADIFAELIELF